MYNKSVFELNIKKAIVIGGSNGIGLSIAKYLISIGVFVNILDVVKPDTTELDEL